MSIVNSLSTYLSLGLVLKQLSKSPLVEENEELQSSLKIALFFFEKIADDLQDSEVSTTCLARENDALRERISHYEGVEGANGSVSIANLKLIELMREHNVDAYCLYIAGMACGYSDLDLLRLVRRNCNLTLEQAIAVAEAARNKTPP